MPESVYSKEKTRKWYNSYQFPLIPVIRVRKADKHNTSSFSFHWLFIQMWTLDSFGFELSIVVSEHWGVGFIGILPYLRWAICVPCPVKIGEWVQRNLWRTPPVYEDWLKEWNQRNLWHKSSTRKS